MKNDAIRSDKEKADEEPINLLSASEHNSNDSNIILTYYDTITSNQPTGKCASLKQNPSYLERRCDPLVIDDRTSVEERNSTNVPMDQKPTDKQATVQSYETCTSQDPGAIHLEQHHIQYLDSYKEISGYGQPTGRNAPLNQFPSNFKYEYNPSESQA